VRVLKIVALAFLSAQTLTAGVGAADSMRETATPGSSVIGATPFDRSARGGIIVEVGLNGRGPFKMLLDTGSSHSAISEDLAHTLGAMPVARAMVASPIEQRLRAVVQITRFEVGPIITNDIFASVIPADAAGRMREFQGLIGQDVLSTRHYTIDFRNQRLLWYAQTAAATGEALTLELDGGRVLVALPQTGSVLRMVPDSAAEALVLFQRRNRPLPPLSASGGRVEVATLLERQYVQQVTLRELRIGRSTVSRLPAIVVAGEHAGRAGEEDGAPACDGLLPLHLFERVTFDGPRRLLIVERPRVPVG
jgi:predicted aspartyl protease